MSYCYLPKPPICVSLDTMFWWSSWCVATTHAQLSAVKSSIRSCIDSLSSFIPRHSHTMWCFPSGLKARVPGDLAWVIATKLESARRMVAWLLARKFAYWNHIEINIQDSHVKPDAATLAWMSSGITHSVLIRIKTNAYSHVLTYLHHTRQAHMLTYKMHAQTLIHSLILQCKVLCSWLKPNPTHSPCLA